MDFSPYGVFAVRNFRRQDFLVYGNFAVRSFRRVEVSPYGFFSVRSFRRVASIEGLMVFSNFVKLNFSSAKQSYPSMVQWEKWTYYELSSFGSVHFACAWYLNTYMYTYKYWKPWKKWMATFKCGRVWMFMTCYVLYKTPNSCKCLPDVVFTSTDSLK